MTRHKITILAIALTAISGYGQNLIKMVEIPAGSFYMGGLGLGENFDEAPVHHVTISEPFRMSETEITNAQYEQFRPEHRRLRGRDGVSTGDNEAVTNVSYDDAVEFCHWLSRREGRNYRLPTEAEWEYACRAGSHTPFWVGDGLPGEFHKNQRVVRDYEPVSLEVKTTPANPWGLYEIHGNVEEWCLDWYAPYDTAEAVNPRGPDKGQFRVTRGGSHNTPERYLRSRNRMAMIPSDRHSLTGFRIVESNARLKPSGGRETTPLYATNVTQERTRWTPVDAPLYIPPIPFVIPPKADSGTPFYMHNHQPAITWADNGDLLALWFSANEENGREVTILASRLTPVADAWQPASLFYKVPDRNMTGTSIYNDGEGHLYHINGVEAAGDWQNLAIAMRQSNDNGETWSDARLILPEHARRHQVIPSTIVLDDGTIIQPCDAGPGSHDGTALQISKDGGRSWYDPWDGTPLPDFARDTTGTTIAGIHAGIVQLRDGRLLALGRGNPIPDENGRPRMPMSLSADTGRTWVYAPSPFPPIDGGQRLVLRRLNEGPLLLISFTDHPLRTPADQRGMDFRFADNVERKCYGMFAAVSFDDGKTWPIMKPISDPTPRYLYGGGWTGFFESDATHAEPRGYLAATQTPDGIIHLLSSRLHYRFNLGWLMTPPVAPESAAKTTTHE